MVSDSGVIRLLGQPEFAQGLLTLHRRHRTIGAAARWHGFAVEARLRAQPIQRVRHNTVAGGREPNHGAADENSKRSPPMAQGQH